MSPLFTIEIFSVYELSVCALFAVLIIIIVPCGLLSAVCFVVARRCSFFLLLAYSCFVFQFRLRLSHSANLFGTQMEYKRASKQHWNDIENWLATSGVPAGRRGRGGRPDEAIRGNERTTGGTREGEPRMNNIVTVSNFRCGWLSDARVSITHTHTHTDTIMFEMQNVNLSENWNVLSALFVFSI